MGSQTFNSNGTFTVPTGVTQITIDLLGAKGGGTGGGNGARVQGTLDVNPGDSLTITLGTSPAATAGGTPGGGASAQSGHGGGGYSSIANGATNLAIAAGGGGQNNTGTGGGGAGGAPNGSAGSGTNPGQGGTTGGGGSAGLTSGGINTSPTPGSSLQGGRGGVNSTSQQEGGGGGGGLFGGGGGGFNSTSASGGGGGGSSLIPSGGTGTAGYNAGATSCTITWVDPNIVAMAAAGGLTVGGAVTIIAAATLPAASTMTVGAAVQIAGAPTFRASATYTCGGANTNRATLVVPASVQAGDLLTAFITQSQFIPLMAADQTGWTSVTSFSNPNNWVTYVYTRLATAADAGATYTWTVAGNFSASVAVLLAHAGPGSQTFDGYASAPSTTGTATAPSVTATVGGTEIIVYSDATTTPITPAADQTSRASTTASYSPLAIAATERFEGPGATGTATATTNGNNNVAFAAVIKAPLTGAVVMSATAGMTVGAQVTVIAGVVMNAQSWVLSGKWQLRWYAGPPVVNEGATPILIENADTINFINRDPNGVTDNYVLVAEGMVLPSYAEAYTIYATSDDNVRVFVNGTLVIDAWIPQGPTQYTWTSGIASTTVPSLIRVEHAEQTGGEQILLEWSSASQVRQPIPVMGSSIKVTEIAAVAMHAVAWMNQGNLLTHDIARGVGWGSSGPSFATGVADPAGGTDAFAITFPVDAVNNHWAAPSVPVEPTNTPLLFTAWIRSADGSSVPFRWSVEDFGDTGASGIAYDAHTADGTWRQFSHVLTTGSVPNARPLVYSFSGEASGKTLQVWNVTVAPVANVLDTELPLIAMAGGAGLTVGSVVTTTSGVAMSAAAAASIAGATAQAGAIAMSAVASLSTSGRATALGLAAMSAAAALAVAAQPLMIFATVNLAGVAGFTAGAVVTELAGSVLSAVAGLSVVAVVTEFAVVTLPAVAGLTATSVVTTFAAVVMAASGSLTVVGAKGPAGTVAMVAVTSLTLQADVTVVAVVILAALPTLIVGGSAHTFAVAALAGVAGLTIGGFVTKSGTVAMHAPATLHVTAVRGVVAAIVFASRASLRAGAWAATRSAVSMSAATALTFPDLVVEYDTVHLAAVAAAVVTPALTTHGALPPFTVHTALTAGDQVATFTGVVLTVVAALTLYDRVTVPDTVVPLIAVAVLSFPVAAVTDVAAVQMHAASSLTDSAAPVSTFALITLTATARLVFFLRLLVMARRYGDAYTAWSSGAARTGWRVGDATLAWRVGILRTAWRTGTPVAEFEAAAARGL